MLSYLLVLAVLAASATAQQILGTCTQEDIVGFGTLLPNGVQCLTAFGVVAEPQNATEDALQQSLSTFCSVDCGEAFAKFSAANCGDFNTGIALALWCLPTGQVGRSYCRYSAPDLLDQTLINGLWPCSQFNSSSPSCPADCGTALMAFANTVGCCYGFLYNSSDALEAYVDNQYISQNQAYYLNNITNPVLWWSCSQPLTQYCDFDPFPGNSVLVAGVCTLNQLATFVSTLSDSCQGNITITVNPATALTQAGEDALDEVCTEDCGGAVFDYERETCQDQFESTYSKLSCYRTEADLGPFCRFTLGPQLRNASFFYDVGASCFSFDPSVGTCPEGCSAALTILSSMLGCCYQTIYNNTDVLDLFLIDGQISFEDRYFFFGRLGYQPAWDACQVPLIAACTGNPFPSPSTSPSPTAGAMKFAASAVVVMLVSLFSSLL